jgi:hypothetical protein
MRPLTVIPRHVVTDLVLSPDGRQLGVVQSGQGFRLLDALTGAELARDTEHDSVHETSPTGRQSMAAHRSAIRLAEVAAGRPFLRFQTGWARSGALNRPPDAPGTSALPRAATITVTAGVHPAARGLAPLPRWLVLGACALSADHRLAVGEWSWGPDRRRFSVLNLATEGVVADLRVRTRQPWEPVHRAFARGETAVVAATAQALCVFELPDAPGVPLAVQPAPVPVLEPVAEVRFTQPQPEPGAPPFAVLPCGQKVLVRGEKSRVELCDLATGEVLTTWKWGLRRLHALAVAADGLTAAAGGFRGEVVIWDLG